MKCKFDFEEAAKSYTYNYKNWKESEYQFNIVKDKYVRETIQQKMDYFKMKADQLSQYLHMREIWQC